MPGALKPKSEATKTEPGLSDSANADGNRKRRNEASLQVPSTIFSNEEIRGLVDEWIISTVVESIIKGAKGLHV
jgi:hypothetical protein